MFSEGKEVARIKEKIIGLLPRYDMYVDEKYKGYVRKELTLLHPRFSVSPIGWKVKGNPWELDYAITDRLDKTIAVVKKGIFNLTDTYTIDIVDDTNCLQVVLTVLAVDIDGTLIEKGHEMHEENRKALNRLMKDDFLVGFVVFFAVVAHVFHGRNGVGD